MLDDIDKDFVYFMKCKFYGWCLIVNNVDFEYFNRRGGFDLDV